MGQQLTQEDVSEILRIVEEAHLDRFELMLGSVRISLHKQDRRQMAVAEALREMPSRGAPRSDASPALLEMAGRSLRTVSVPSPHVGIFFRTLPFVRPGSRVDVDAVIGQISMLQGVVPVTASVRGIVSAVCVDDGAFVEYGQPLVRVQTQLPDRHHCTGSHPQPG